MRRNKLNWHNRVAHPVLAGLVRGTAVCLAAISPLHAGDGLAPEPGNRNDSAHVVDAGITAARSGWELAWSDEFDRDGLPDPSRWDYEEGFIRNDELQYYTRARPENARVENGMLVIEGRKECHANPRHKAGSTRWQERRQEAGYTSASLITLRKADWQYGRIEVRAKLPEGKGVWPAIWCMGANRDEVGWPRCGEIDIMEFIGKMPDTIHGTVHYPANNERGRASSGGKLRKTEPCSDFHVYAIEWTAERIDFFFDETKYHSFELERATVNGDNPFRKPFYLLINLALGGSWGGQLDDGVLPARYLVDYVRVYRATTASDPAR